MAAPRVCVFPSARELGPALSSFVLAEAARAVSQRGRFAVAVSGGSLVSLLAAELPDAAAREPEHPGANWSRWVLGFCDERLVPFESPDSTCGLYRVR
eukprot:g36391.t1